MKNLGFIFTIWYYMFIAKILIGLCKLAVKEVRNWTEPKHFVSLSLVMTLIMVQFGFPVIPIWLVAKPTDWSALNPTTSIEFLDSYCFWNFLRYAFPGENLCLDIFQCLDHQNYLVLMLLNAAYGWIIFSAGYMLINVNALENLMCDNEVDFVSVWVSLSFVSQIIEMGIFYLI